MVTLRGRQLRRLAWPPNRRPCSSPAGQGAHRSLTRRPASARPTRGWRAAARAPRPTARGSHAPPAARPRAQARTCWQGWCTNLSAGWAGAWRIRLPCERSAAHRVQHATAAPLQPASPPSQPAEPRSSAHVSLAVLREGHKLLGAVLEPPEIAVLVCSGAVAGAWVDGSAGAGRAAIVEHRGRRLWNTAREAARLGLPQKALPLPAWPGSLAWRAGGCLSERGQAERRVGSPRQPGRRRGAPSHPGLCVPPPPHPRPPPPSCTCLRVGAFFERQAGQVSGVAASTGRAGMRCGRWRRLPVP